jgi:hypothetical protein
MEEEVINGNSKPLKTTYDLKLKTQDREFLYNRKNSIKILSNRKTKKV